MKRPRILIAAAGSGGHIFPAVAIAEAIRRRRPDTAVRFVGSDKALDRRIFEKEGVDFRVISANRLPSKFGFRVMPFLLLAVLDLVKAVYIIAVFGPDVIIGFGGYVSFVAGAAAKMCFKPFIIHEQNVRPGRANMLSFSLSDRIAVSYKQTAQDCRCGVKRKMVFTGNPIRRDVILRQENKDGCYRQFGMDAAKFTILVIGGSQGAHFLNENFIKFLAVLDTGLKKRLQVLHLTGIKDYEWAMRSYFALQGLDSRVFSFIDNIGDIYAISDLVITRSGASAIFELAALGKPMILVPYPLARNHQLENAAAFSANGAGILIEEKELNPAKFKELITSLVGDRKKLDELGSRARSMAVPDASDRVAEMAEEFIE